MGKKDARFSDPEALEHTPTIRSVIKGCIDDHVKQHCEVQLDAATTVKELYTILNEQEEIFWPPEKCQKTFMKTTRKNSEDLLTYMSELQKKAKFGLISQIIDGQSCNHYYQIVQVDENNEAAAEKFIILV